MIKARDINIDQTRTARLLDAWRQLLADNLRRDFHGTVSIEIHVQDGIVQHFRRKVERLERVER